jgi:hypothetical protein
MKRFLSIVAVMAIVAACSEPVNYKTERDEVMKFHDVVMEDHGILIANQMKLDSMLKDLPALQQKFPAIDTAKEKVVLQLAIASLADAETLMNDWMHKFEPDVSGKSNEEAVVYFKAERAKIAKIDSLYKGQIKASNQYIAQFRK